MWRTRAWKTEDEGLNMEEGSACRTLWTEMYVSCLIFLVLCVCGVYVCLRAWACVVLVCACLSVCVCVCAQWQNYKVKEAMPLRIMGPFFPPGINKTSQNTTPAEQDGAPLFVLAAT